MIWTIGILVLLAAVCDVISGQGAFSARRRFFGGVLGRLGKPQPTCDWVSNPRLLKELKWKEQLDLCFETGPQYHYPQ